MDKLEQLLRNPASHSDVPSSEQVRLWSEKALERWAMENQDGVRLRNQKIERAKEWAFGLSLASCLAFLLLVLVNTFTPAFADFRMPGWNLPTGEDVALMMSAYSTSISVVICAAAILATRPLREFLLDQLD